MDDERFMRLALAEARKGVGHASPNPMVGAVIVSPEGRILGRGHHRAAGRPHAEIEALRSVEDRAATRGATLCVTLEPCSTQGRTPPCTAAILEAGFARVVVGATDPNPAHAGRGFALLRRAGIEVRIGVLAARCAALNRAFNKWIVERVPLVIAKAALSMDGRLSRPAGEGQWLTGKEARRDAQELRASVDAILVGAGTLRADNPRLTVRGIHGARQPWRVVLTESGDLPRNAHLFTDAHRARTLVYRREPGSGRIEVRRGGAGEPEAAIPWRRRSLLLGVLEDLGRREVTSVMIEGGNRVLSDAFDERLVDRVHFYMAPLLCGGPEFAVGGRGVGASGESPALSEPEYRRIGDDLRLTADVVRAG